MPQQLDIFNDSRDVALRNGLAQSLLDGNADAAQQSADALAAEFAADPVLAPAATLIEHLHSQQRQAANGRQDVAAVLAARQHLDSLVTAAAAAVLGAHDAPAWLTRQWCWLAAQAEGVAWHPPHADAHAAGLYLRGLAWQSAAEAVARIPSWRRIPVPLLWMAHARWRSDGADAAWPLLAEALWLAPARAAALLPALADKGLARLLVRFEERFDTVATEGANGAWLPAFALVDQPLLAGPLSPASPAAETAPSQAFQLMLALLRLERQGRHAEIVAHRARLKSLSAPLFAAYMRTR